MLRAMGASVTAMVLVLFIGPAFIRWLRSNEFGQSIREEGPERHQAKAGTPTMGGLLVWLAVVVSYLIYSRFSVASVTVLTGLAGARTAARDLKASIGAEKLTFSKADRTLHEEPRSLRPVYAKIGPEFRAHAKEVNALIAEADPVAVAKALKEGGWEVEYAAGKKAKLTAEHITVESGWVSHGKAVHVLSAGEAVVVIRIE